MLRTIFVVLFASMALIPLRLHAAPLAKDCLSAGSGAWSEPATWMGCDGGTPQAADNAYLQAGHTIQLTADAAVADLHINVGVDAASYGTGARLLLGSHALDLYGKLRSYTGAVGAIPGQNILKIAPDAITITAGSGGRIRAVGPSHTLTVSGEWGTDLAPGSPSTFALEIAADPAAVIRMDAVIRASAFLITSGTLDTNQTLLVDQGTADTGDVTIGPQGTLISAATISVPLAGRPASGRGGTFTVNGRLVLTKSGPRINMLTTALNNIVEYNGAIGQSLLTKVSGSGVYQYNNLVLSGGGAKMLVDNTTVTGSLTRSGTATLSLGSGTLKKLTYGADAALVYAGTELQTTGLELPAAAEGIGSLRVENPAGVKLGQGLLVKGSLVLEGDLDTGAYVLKLGPEATCAGAGDVLGTAQRPGVPAPGTYCLGNPNFQITLSQADLAADAQSTAQSTALPAALPTSLTAVFARGTAPFSGALLLRYTIDAPGFAGTATLRLPYDEGDLNGNDPAKLHLWHLAGDNWTLQPATTRGVDGLGKHYVESGGVTGFSDWTLSAGGAPAAVTVLDWAAGWVDGHVRLRWQTASEIDCVGFRITRSRTHGDRGEQVAEVAAQVPGSAWGAVYIWDDTEMTQGGEQMPGAHYYWLDVIDQEAGIVSQSQPAMVGQPGVYLPTVAK
ncbi:MAG: hypothetical protein U0X20_19605 [Caldilineaceae bacterium]